MIAQCSFEQPLIPILSLATFGIMTLEDCPGLRKREKLVKSALSVSSSGVVLSSITSVGTDAAGLASSCTLPPATLPPTFPFWVESQNGHCSAVHILEAQSILIFDRSDCMCGFDLTFGPFPFPFRFNPSQFVEKWSTPQLIVHGGKDYRLAETEGLAAFNALQQYVSLRTFFRYRGRSRSERANANLIVFAIDVGSQAALFSSQMRIIGSSSQPIGTVPPFLPSRSSPKILMRRARLLTATNGTMRCSAGSTSLLEITLNKAVSQQCNFSFASLAFDVRARCLVFQKKMYNVIPRGSIPSGRHPREDSNRGIFYI